MTDSSARAADRQLVFEGSLRLTPPDSQDPPVEIELRTEPDASIVLSLSRTLASAHRWRLLRWSWRRRVALGRRLKALGQPIAIEIDGKQVFAIEPGSSLLARWMGMDGLRVRVGKRAPKKD